MDIHQYCCQNTCTTNARVVEEEEQEQEEEGAPSENHDCMHRMVIYTAFDI